VYVWPLVFGTVWAAAIALIIATPISIGVALFISHYAPRRIAQLLGYVIDLLAAVPSVVFGLWGIQVLAPAVQPFYVWLNEHAAWIPLFGGDVSGTGRTILTVAIVLAVMVLPIMTAVCREVFLQTPKLHEEAALALGATRWEMIRVAVLPFGRPGIISAAMLGLGRALGETMAVAMVLSPAVVVSFFLLTSQNPNTIAANIALQFPEAAGIGVNTLIASGLVLFVITFIVNAIARYAVNRRKAFSGAN
jgi:phosphate transport system permease protein